MGTSLSSQGQDFLSALLLGTSLALFYDLLRALRLRRAKDTAFTAALDLLYCVLLVPALLLFTLRIGDGELRLYMLLASLAAALLYFSLFARFLRPLWAFWADVLFALARLIWFPFRQLKIFYGKLAKLCKRYFLFSRRRFIIKAYERSALRAERKRAKRRSKTHGRAAEK